jgi:methylthioribulose-1-phosphate dehydratase
VAGGFAGGEDGVCYTDLLAIVQGVVDFGGWELHGGIGTISEVGFAARFDSWHVGVHDAVARAGLLLELGAAGAVVVVGVADEQGFDLMGLEAELLDAGLNLGGGCGQVAVDEDVAAGRGDEIAGEVAAADVVEVAGDAEGRHRGGPIGGDAGIGLGGAGDGVEDAAGCDGAAGGEEGSSAGEHELLREIQYRHAVRWGFPRCVLDLRECSFGVTGRFMGSAPSLVQWNDALLKQAESLCEAAHECARRGWVPATAGNFSFRDGASGRIFITASGLDKGAITPEDLLEIDVDCNVIAGAGKPSAETSLHGVIYRDRASSDSGAMAIFHVHSIWNTLLSDRFAKTGAVPIENYELLKALWGVGTHEHRELVPILENSQKYGGLARELEAVLGNYPGVHGVLLRRHGLYTWGESIAGARRHVEALEFLFEVESRRLGWGS